MTLCRSLPLLLTLQFLFPVSLSSQPPQNRADLIITGGTVITMDGARTIYDDGAVVVRGDTIVAVGPRAEVEAKYASSQTIDAHGNREVPEEVARRSADLRGSSAAFDLHLFTKNASGCHGLGAQISCADSDPRC